jgi:hypothetical protein
VSVWYEGDVNRVRAWLAQDPNKKECAVDKVAARDADIKESIKSEDKAEQMNDGGRKRKTAAATAAAPAMVGGGRGGGKEPVGEPSAKRGKAAPGSSKDSTESKDDRAAARRRERARHAKEAVTRHQQQELVKVRIVGSIDEADDPEALGSDSDGPYEECGECGEYGVYDQIDLDDEGENVSTCKACGWTSRPDDDEDDAGQADAGKDEAEGEVKKAAEPKKASSLRIPAFSFAICET